MVDELDRILTAYGTISVKTPDVWGQDRLAKFRSEYESQMAAWLKVGFKGDINASIRRAESESTLRSRWGRPSVRTESAKSTTPPAQTIRPVRRDVQESGGSERSQPGVEPDNRESAGFAGADAWCSTSTPTT